MLMPASSMFEVHSSITLILLLTGSTCVYAIGMFWQIGDFHYDYTYSTTGESCMEKLPVNELGEYGNIYCDAPWKLIEDSIEALARLIEASQQPSFIIWIGDNVLHPTNHSFVNKEMVIEINKNITDLFKRKLPEVPVYATIGNHDYYPTNQLPGESNEQYNILAELWSDWLEDGAKETFKKGAYYTQPINGVTDQHVMVVNTNLYYTSNDATKDMEDPGEQFKWMETVLAQARADEKKVHLILHIPSGYLAIEKNHRFFTANANTRFNDIIRRYGDIILGLYTGHIHTDNFALFYNKTQPIATMFISPSVTPWSGGFVPRNPALRCYTFNEANGELLDIEQYFLDLGKANSGSDVEWKQEYTFSETYEIQDIKPATLDEVLKDLKKDDSKYFNKYAKYVYVSIDDPGAECDASCKIPHLCAIEFVDNDDYDACIKEGEKTVEPGSTAGRSLFSIYSLILAVVLSLVCIC